MSQSIGLLEVKGLLASVEATDAMVKSTYGIVTWDVNHHSETVLLVIVGEYNAVCASLEIGLRQAQSFRRGRHQTRDCHSAFRHKRCSKIYCL